MICKHPARQLVLSFLVLSVIPAAFSKERPEQLLKLARRQEQAKAAKPSIPVTAPFTSEARRGTSSASLALTSNGNPIRYGSPVTLTATVTPNTATGLVTFNEGGIPIGSSTLVQGIANFSTVLLDAGTDYLTAHYGGNATFVGATSPQLPQTIADGDGIGFPFYTTINVGTNPAPVASWTAVGDFNGDGKQDLATVLTGTNQIAISLGTGTGTFNAPLLFNTGIGPYAVVIGDFNQDGFEDLAVSSDDGIDILLGTGQGRFLNYTPYATPVTGSGSPSFGLAVADFNGDGIPDLVVTDGLATDSSGINGLVSVFLGAGNGTFPSRTDYSVGQLPQAVTVGDFNGDGHSDFAAADILDNTVYVYLGNGSGGFTLAPGSPVITGNQPNDITSLTLNGRLDLVVANATDNQVQILTGSGNGDFTPQPGVNVGNEPDSLVVADFNGDLVPDIAVLNSFDNSVTVLLNLEGQLTPTGPPAGVCTICNYVQISAGDFNNDGLTDLVIADQGQDTPPGGLNLLLGEGCSYSISPSSIYQSSSSGSQTMTLAGGGTSCTWTSSNTNSWITLNPSSGGGTGGSVIATFASNTTGVDRSGTFTVGGQIVSVTQRSTAEVFTDVTPSAYYFDAVNLLSAKGITSGCGSSDFCPTETVTRAQMAIFIVRSIYNGSDNFPYSLTPYFADVPSGSFGFPWIQHLKELGITTGCNSVPDFCPNESVTRDQMAIFIIRARFGASTTFTFPTAPYFSDVPASYYAFEWIQRLAYDNITTGCSPTQYCPAEAVSRGDMSIFIMRGEFNDLLPPEMPVITTISPTVLPHGQAEVFTITGLNTSFVAGQTKLVFGTASGITVNTVNVDGPTSMTVSLSASSTAPLDPNSIYVQTGTQEAVLPNGLVVQ